MPSDHADKPLALPSPADLETARKALSAATGALVSVVGSVHRVGDLCDEAPDDIRTILGTVPTLEDFGRIALFIDDAKGYVDELDEYIDSLMQYLRDVFTVRDQAGDERLSLGGEAHYGEEPSYAR